ncbi:MAG: bifunctional UDP-N-acetylglucosamine diphosphorylase/glucosamine-1-phosphate N-acetyltransferase GlmU [Candidatus Muirbacterium halophilum]|nr:bifunctional UDP-N-acetylglucosamine diphosphorylase/glucosamine-1-phosphate N-acetyltransferase GlmU [Candidatus Muirbacterium halophilum]MCK9474792.1 bifunctional UDP-N-acetylglucosamine diphosphorylase/glucosamine-1-phosphate N-acetyltransferase GlmU [Candidatus Muirbacterium halophilum]
MDILILAAGKGTRMKSNTPKVLFEIAGKPMLWWVINSCKNLSNKVNILLGHQPDLIKEKMPYISNESIFIQKQQLGTGHAVRTFIEEYKEDFDSLMILCGDTPMLSSQELENFKKNHIKSKAVISVMSAIIKNPLGYGRIIKKNNKLACIIEEKDADYTEKKINEINSGIYIIDSKFLKEEIFNINSNNSQNEFYLTDLVEKAFNKGLITNVYIGNSENLSGINDIQSLSEARKIIHNRINNEFMNNGVDIYNSETTFIDVDTVIEDNVSILPFTVLKGENTIGKNSIIGPNVYIEDCKIENSKIEYSHLKGVVVNKGCNIGPYSRIRENTVIGEKCRVGNFVEIKKTCLDKSVKVSHLSYIGDSDIGKNTNIGAGTITCNYDGVNKHKTKIGENSFIGSNSCLIAPVNLGNNSVTAAGSVITKDVPDNSLAFGRARQIIKLNYRREK